MELDRRMLVIVVLLCALASRPAPLL